MSDKFQLEKLRRMLMNPGLESGLYLIDTDLSDSDIEIIIKGIDDCNFVKEQLMSSSTDSPLELFVTGLSCYCANDSIRELRSFLLNPNCRKRDSILYSLLINILGYFCSVSKTIFQVYGDYDLSVLIHEEINILNGALQHYPNKAIIVCKHKDFANSSYDPLIKKVIFTDVLERPLHEVDAKTTQGVEPTKDMAPVQNSTVIQYGKNSLYIGNNTGTIILGSGITDGNSPDKNEARFDDIANKIINDLENARVSIHICMAWFTNQRIADKLIEKFKEGLDVKVISYDDHTNAKFGVNIENIPHRRIKGTKGGTMHHKFCVIDNQKVITGSYNWSENAEKKNDENAAMIYDDKFASDYSVKFRELFGE